MISKLHAKSRENRYQSAEEVANLLAECIAHVQTPSTPLPPELRRDSRPARRRILWLSCIAVILMAVAVWWNWPVADVVVSPAAVSSPVAPTNAADLKWRIDDELSPDAIHDRVQEIGREIDESEM